MSDNITASIVLVSKFVNPNNRYYKEYINYIDRSDAVRNESYFQYSAYADRYMDDDKKTQHTSTGFTADEIPKKTSALFTKEQDRCSKETLEKIKSQFELAQESGSPMWQTVISFDNRFLSKHNLYCKKTNTVDELHIRRVTRTAMEELLKRESMEGSAIWTAAIHYNTDNIHVHIATVEPHPTRPIIIYKGKEMRRGSFRKGSLYWMESKAANALVDRTAQRDQINQLIRSNMVASKRTMKLNRDSQLKELFFNIYRRLPADRRMWNYNQNAMKYLVPQINKLTNEYIKLYHQNDFTNVCRLLIKEEDYLKELYGVGQLARYADYKENKIHDLYERMGNAILKECREYSRQEQKWLHQISDSKLGSVKQSQSNKHGIVDSLKGQMNRTYQKWRNQKSYEQLLNSLEQDHGYE